MAIETGPTTGVEPTTPAARARLLGSLSVYAALAFTIAAWSGSFVAARMLLSPMDVGEPALSPTLLATIRFLLASAVFVPMLLRQHTRTRPIQRRDLPLFLLLGQLGISGYFWLQYTGVKLTNAGVSAVLAVSVIPLATMVISALVLRESMTWRRTLALAMGVAGVVIVVSQQSLEVSIETGFLFGALCHVANGLGFAVYSVLIRSLSVRYSSVTVTGGIMVSGTIGLVLLALVTEDWTSATRLSGAQWLAILYLVGACSVLAYLLYNYALKRLEASKVAAWLYTEPVLAVVLAAVMLGETVALQTVLGAAVILTGLYITQRT